MALKQQQIQIGLWAYELTQLDARQGIRAAARLANALAPSFKALPAEGFKLTPEQAAAFVEPALRDPALAETVLYLCDIFAERTAVLGEKRDERTGESVPTRMQLSRILDQHFADSYDDMILWLVASIKFSLASLFRSVQGIAALVPRTEAQGSGSQSPTSP